MLLIRDFFPEGRAIISSPFLTIPEAIFPLNPRSQDLGGERTEQDI